MYRAILIGVLVNGILDLKHVEAITEVNIQPGIELLGEETRNEHILKEDFLLIQNPDVISESLIGFKSKDKVITRSLVERNSLSLDEHNDSDLVDESKVETDTGGDETRERLKRCQCYGNGEECSCGNRLNGRFESGRQYKCGCDDSRRHYNCPASKKQNLSFRNRQQGNYYDSAYDGGNREDVQEDNSNSNGNSYW